MVNLKRVALDYVVAPEEIIIDPLQQELAAKARKVLGYGLLEERLKKDGCAQVRERIQLSTLAQVFQRLDIQPFELAEVAKYQEEEKKKANRKSAALVPLYAKLWILITKFFQCSFGRIRSGGLLSLLMVCLMIAPVAEILLLVFGHLVAALVVSPFALLGCGAYYALGLNNRMMDLYIREWEWEGLSFEECAGRGVEIPEFVLHTAIRIKQEMPKADLFVEALVGTDRSLGDPFLCLKQGDKKYYLEVWDESRFERSMIR